MASPPFRVINDLEVDRLERAAFNPPHVATPLDRSAFEQEWFSVHSSVLSRLAIFGEEWTSERQDGDFMLGDIGDDRWIYVTFTSPRLWREDLVPAVSSLLQTLPYDYAITFLTELNDEEVMDHPLVYLVVTKNEVLGHASEQPEILSRFGFPRQDQPDPNDKSAIQAVAGNRHSVGNCPLTIDKKYNSLPRSP